MTPVEITTALAKCFETYWTTAASVQKWKDKAMVCREHTMHIILYNSTGHPNVLQDEPRENITTFLAQFSCLAASILINLKIFETLFYRLESSDLCRLEADSFNKRLFHQSWWKESAVLLHSDFVLHCWVMRRADLVRIIETLYAEAGPRLYLMHLAPFQSSTNDLGVLKELVLIERLLIAKKAQR